MGPKVQRSNYKISPGVYVFHNTKTGDMYVGSSIVLSNRLRVYFTDHSKANDTRAVVKSLNDHGTSAFVLSIYQIEASSFGPDFNTIALSLCRALE